jgi:hypothetical protein
VVGVIGQHGQYRWLSSADHELSAFVRLCPGVLIGRRVAVTSFDSGALTIREQEKNLGWTSDDRRIYSFDFGNAANKHQDLKIAYSPVLTCVDGSPHEMNNVCRDGYDEWYVFDGDVPDSDLECFVNWMGFSLPDSEDFFDWLRERFWNEMERAKPESYISEGTAGLTFVTRNTDLFGRVVAALAADLA